MKQNYLHLWKVNKKNLFGIAVLLRVHITRQSCVMKYKAISIGCVILTIITVVVLLIIKQKSAGEKHSKLLSNNKKKLKELCGINGGFMGTSFGDERTEKGEWPWNVAFIKNPVGFVFCGGTLVSSKHVLSGDEVFFLLIFDE